MSRFIQVLFFKSSAYTANPSKYDSAILSEFGKADGVLARYKGTDIAEANYHVYVVVWASQAQFEKFKGEVGTKLIEPFQGDLEGAPDVNTVDGGNADYAKILGAPIVHFTLVQPKSGVAPEEVRPIAEQLVKLEESSQKSLGFLRSHVNEKPNNFLAIVGWNSKEDHDATAAGLFAGPLGQLREKVDAEIRLTKLTAYTS